jgi:murein peptide amidase A
MMNIIQQFHRKILGSSVQNRPIEGVFLGEENPTRINTLFIGAFHGDETISAEVLFHFIEHLQKGKFAKNTIDFHKNPTLIIPVLNPDGLAQKTRVNANQVDLNRNYPTPDWQEENQGTKYYSGKSEASEPETRLVIHLIEHYQPQKIVTVHSPYKVLNFDGPARELADTMAAESGYTVVESIGYPTPGSFGTYAGKIRQIPVITLELPPGFDEPPDPDAAPPETLEQVWQDNWAALEAAIRF